MKMHWISCVAVGAALALVLVAGPATGQHATRKPQEPTAADKCPVCGMFVKDYPRWWAEIVYGDGKAVFFDGPKDLFKYLLTPSAYGGRKTASDAALYVREYYSLRWIDARTPFYVIDSDVYGPMGHELVPLASEDDAREFKADHRGSRILRYGDVTWELLTRLSEGQDM